MVGLQLWGAEKPRSCSHFAAPCVCAPQSVCGCNVCFCWVAEPSAVQGGHPQHAVVRFFFFLRALVRRNGKRFALHALFS